MSRTPVTARRLFDRLEPVHAVTYFTPESVRAFEEAGYRGFWMAYFAGRAAPLGPVPADVVTAVFYNFSAEHVARALPSAWDFAPPADALAARQTSAVAALQRCGIDGDGSVETAAALLAKAARSADLAGRPLFAANRALPWPDDPVAALWHAATLLREHRGDGHIAVLVAAGVTGRESNVLHSAADRVPRDFIVVSRRYDVDEWDACVESLCARGLLDAAGRLTEAGRDLKLDVEATTDRLALSAFDALDDDELETLFGALTPLTRRVVAAGDIPVATPMGLQRHELDDDSAGLG